MRSLAFKWIRILYRCWKDGAPYDEARYLAAPERRGSPLYVSTTPFSPEHTFTTGCYGNRRNEAKARSPRRGREKGGQNLPRRVVWVHLTDELRLVGPREGDRR